VTGRSGFLQRSNKTQTFRHNGSKTAAQNAPCLIWQGRGGTSSRSPLRFEELACASAHQLCKLLRVFAGVHGLVVGDIAIRAHSARVIFRPEAASSLAASSISLLSLLLALSHISVSASPGRACVLPGKRLRWPKLADVNVGLWEMMRLPILPGLRFF